MIPVPIKLSYFFVKEYKTLNLLYPELLDDKTMEFSESDIEQRISEHSRRELITMRNASYKQLRYMKEQQKMLQGRKKEIVDILKKLRRDEKADVDHLIEWYENRHETTKNRIANGVDLIEPFVNNVIRPVRRIIRNGIKEDFHLALNN